MRRWGRSLDPVRTTVASHRALSVILQLLPSPFVGSAPQRWSGLQLPVGPRVHCPAPHMVDSTLLTHPKPAPDSGPLCGGRSLTVSLVPSVLGSAPMCPGHRALPPSAHRPCAAPCTYTMNLCQRVAHCNLQNVQEGRLCQLGA